MTTGLWVTQIWLESQLCPVTSPPAEKGLQLLSQRRGDISPHTAVGPVNTASMKHGAWAPGALQGRPSFSPAWSEASPWGDRLLPSPSSHTELFAATWQFPPRFIPSLPGAGDERPGLEASCPQRQVSRGAAGGLPHLCLLGPRVQERGRASPAHTRHEAHVCSCLKQGLCPRARAVGPASRALNLGPDAHSLRKLVVVGEGVPSLVLSLSFLICQMGRTRSLQRFRVCVK